jgi:hypothetical protein
MNNTLNYQYIKPKFSGDAPIWCVLVLLFIYFAVLWSFRDAAADIHHARTTSHVVNGAETVSLTSSSPSCLSESSESDNDELCHAEAGRLLGKMYGSAPKQGAGPASGDGDEVSSRQKARVTKVSLPWLPNALESNGAHSKAFLVLLTLLTRPNPRILGAVLFLGGRRG